MKILKKMTHQKMTTYYSVLVQCNKSSPKSLFITKSFDEQISEIRKLLHEICERDVSISVYEYKNDIDHQPPVDIGVPIADIADIEVTESCQKIMEYFPNGYSCRENIHIYILGFENECIPIHKIETSVCENMV